ncbi:helix-turn-helix transcriptional regulator [Macrococcus capreoli]
MKEDLLITMRAARVNAGYSQSEASQKLGINKDTLWRYEKNNSTIPRNIIDGIEKLYKVPSNNIFFGSESEFIRNLRKDVQ